MLESMFAFLLYTFLVWPEQNLRYLSLRCADSLFSCDDKFQYKKPVVLRLFLIAYTPLGKSWIKNKNHVLIHVFPVFLPGDRFTEKRWYIAKGYGTGKKCSL